MDDNNTKGLTNSEVVGQLRRLLKPYIGIMSQAQFSNQLTRIENDLSKPITVMKFFDKFGYVGQWNDYKEKATN